jgi:hypothetical protein
MTFDGVDTRIVQPMEHDIHRGIRGEYHVPWVDRNLHERHCYGLLSRETLLWVIIMDRELMASLSPARYINAITIIIMLNILYK